MLDHKYNLCLWLEAAFIFTIWHNLSGTQRKYNSTTAISCDSKQSKCWMTKCSIFDCIAGRVNITHHTSVKAHLSRTCRWWLSFQTWRCQQTNTTAACYCTQNTAPCWALPPQGPGQWKEERHTDRCVSALCPMGVIPVLAAGESTHTARHWVAPAHTHFVSENKGAVQTSSFMYDWLKGFF